MATYNTSEFKKGLKVQIDGEPYQMVECNFRKPGKGNAIYTVRLRNLIKGTTLEKNYKGGESLESADVTEIDAQFLYRQQDMFVFMDNVSYEQYELSKDQVDDAWKYLKEGMVVSMVLYNENPITVTPPNHVELTIQFCEPSIKGNTATGLTKPVTVETGADVMCPAFVEIGEVIRVDTRTGEYIERVKQ